MHQTDSHSDKSLTGRIYGGLSLTWPLVLFMAVGAGALTAAFLILPVFKGTSFERMGVHLEAWFIPAVLIMANAKKPLEAALKTFVFFLVSQPLIYLIQVPFSALGWGLFRFYGYWFLFTLLTFPMAWIGWHISRKNWLSVLILAPVLAFLGMTFFDAAGFCLRHFPHLLVTALLCLGQVLVYTLAFGGDGKKRLVCLLAAAAGVLIIALTSRKLEINNTLFLPEGIVLTEEAQVLQEEEGAAEISLESTGEDPMIRVRTEQYGTTDFVIRDGDTEYAFTVEVYEDDGGHTQIEVEQR